jgi:hypothetical protein
MVLGGENHVLLPCAFCQASPLTCEAYLGLEVLRQKFVLRNRNAFGLENPLLLPNDAVETPVDEHTEASLLPPGDAAGSRLFLVGELSVFGGERICAGFLCEGNWSRDCDGSTCNGAGGGEFDKASARDRFKRHGFASPGQ